MRSDIQHLYFIAEPKKVKLILLLLQFIIFLSQIWVHHESEAVKEPLLATTYRVTVQFTFIALINNVLHVQISCKQMVGRGG